MIDELPSNNILMIDKLPSILIIDELPSNNRDYRLRIDAI